MNTADTKAFKVVDVHNHYGDLVMLEPWSDTLAVRQRERLDHIAQLDRRGVDQAVVIPTHGYLRARGVDDMREINDAVVAYRDETIDRFPAAVGIVEPLFGAAGLEEVTRCKDELNLCGISFHTRFQGVSLEHPWLLRYLERMGEIGLVPFLHAVGESPEESLWKVDFIAADFPDLPMIVLDAFSTFEQIKMVRRVADQRPNLMFDTALSIQGFDPGLAIAKEFGAHRVLYGSDLYSAMSNRQLPDVLEQILAADLPPDDKTAILSGNAIRVLGIPTEDAVSATVGS
jgi:predicted TIM-barrel fold metal-dependent hydrolase